MPNVTEKAVGCVYLVGAGPGDAGLLTQRARNLIAACDVLVYDALSNLSFTALAGASCKKIYVGKQPGKHSVRQEEINALLVEHALSGSMVVRLKGGDPFVFGRGGEEAQALEAHNVPYQLVPGVTSAVAALESAGVPVTHREVARSFTVITGHTKAEEAPAALLQGKQASRFAQYAAVDGTLVFLMGVAALPEIASALIAGGKEPETPVAIVEQGTTVRERRINGTLSTIVQIAAREQVKNPAVICVGDVAAFDFTSSRLPLAKKRIAVTGTAELTEKLSRKLKDAGALVCASPYMQAQLVSEVALPAFSDISWLIFTSANGVRFFFSRLKALKTDIRALSHVRFCVIGSGTAQALAEYGFVADYVPERYTVSDMAQGLCSLLQKENAAGLSRKGIICALRAQEGSSDLASALDAACLSWRDIPLYALSVCEAEISALLSTVDVLDYITFASASGARAFFEHYAASGTATPLSEACAFVCIGAKTAETVRDFAARLSLHNRILTAAGFTADGIITAIKGDCHA